jgi:drug/metabolite transporter (DMT)-like permease
MNFRVLKANLILFTAALVWGATFVAQRVGMDHVGPLTFTAVRFTLGALFLLPWAWFRRHRRYPGFEGSAGRWLPLWAGALAGTAMCAGINLQQIGLVSTTAGNAGFITGLYVIIVPILGFFLGHRPSLGVWIGAVLGAVGLYLLSVTSEFKLLPGDGWVLACAFAWAGHVWLVAWLSPKMDSYVLAFGQASVCALLSFIIALFTEEMSWAALAPAWLPILWGGLMSVGVGFTLQVIGQKNSPAAHAAIILSLEAVVAAISGWLILGETMGGRGAWGAGLMLSGMLIAQLWSMKKQGPDLA